MLRPRLCVISGRAMSVPGGSGAPAAWPSEGCLCVCACVHMCVHMCVRECLSPGTSIFHRHQKTDPLSAATFLQPTKPLFSVYGRAEMCLQLGQVVFKRSGSGLAGGKEAWPWLFCEISPPFFLENLQDSGFLLLSHNGSVSLGIKSTGRNGNTLQTSPPVGTWDSGP